ncbi:hypothetical protein HMPREF9193_01444 [Treponema lecithinolyticum ATCC 700332]|uniref:Uncharacterized protein n=1 Tax=Treponema lecithinolyticum ATCC 700332 TaxID=1321815 RepID=A0ABN0NXM3_TRELE|nr:hypothetical protein HMPREF9193_01444 [Treponema lecithinolyticum ATCC 700332]
MNLFAVFIQFTLHKSGKTHCCFLPQLSFPSLFISNYPVLYAHILRETLCKRTVRP